MKILFDVSSLLKEITGIGVFAKHICEQIIQNPSGHEYILCASALKGRNPDWLQKSGSKISYVRRHLPGKLLLELWRYFDFITIESVARVKNVDLFFSPNYFYQSTKIHKKVAAIHDLSFLRNKRYGSRYSGEYHRNVLPGKIGKLDKIIVPSQHTSKDIREFFPQINHRKIHVVHFGIDACYHPLETDARNTTYYGSWLPEKYFLTAGTVEPRKNHEFLIKAFSNVSKKFPEYYLIIAGNHTKMSGHLIRLADELGVGKKVMFTGYIDSTNLITLMQKAKLAIFPSWDEGFGFCELEVMACGVPIAASDIAIHHEMLGDSSFYFSIETTEALETLLSDFIKGNIDTTFSISQGLEWTKKYSWEETYRKIVHVFESLDTNL